MATEKARFLNPLPTLVNSEKAANEHPKVYPVLYTDSLSSFSGEVQLGTRLRSAEGRQLQACRRVVRNTAFFVIDDSWDSQVLKDDPDWGQQFMRGELWFQGFDLIWKQVWGVFDTIEPPEVEPNNQVVVVFNTLRADLVHVMTGHLYPSKAVGESSSSSNGTPVIDPCEKYFHLFYQTCLINFDAGPDVSSSSSY